MEEMIVVCFTLEEEKSARKHRWDPWQFHVDNTVIHCGEQAVGCVNVYLPAYGRKRKEWTEEQFAGYFEGIPQLPGEGRTVYYLPDAGARRLMGRGAEPLTYEWTKLLITCYAGAFESLVILEDRDMEADGLVRDYVRQAKYLAVVTNEVDRWQDMTEYLSEEYGVLLDVVDGVKKLHLSHKGRILFIAGSRLYGCVPAWLPKGCVWLSTQPEEADGRKMCAHAKDVEYVSFQRVLSEMKHKRGITGAIV